MKYIPHSFGGSQYQSGIYVIESSCGKKYIGSATKLRARFMAHRRNLEIHKHDNSILQNISDKYGIGSLSFSVIELCDRRELINREQFYIDLYSPEINICRIAGATYGLSAWIGRKHTEETKRKIKESNLKTFSKREKKKTFIKLTREENIKRFSEINKSPEKRKMISDRMMGNKNWLGKKHKQETIENRIGCKNPNAKKIYCPELNMFFECGINAVVFFGVSKSMITATVRGDRRIDFNNIKCTLKYQSQL